MSNKLTAQLKELENTIADLKAQYLKEGSAILLAIIANLEDEMEKIKGIVASHDEQREAKDKLDEIKEYQYIKLNDLVNGIQSSIGKQVVYKVEFDVLGLFAKVTIECISNKKKFDKLTINIPYIINEIDPNKEIEELRVKGRRFCFSDQPTRDGKYGSIGELIVDTKWINHLNEGQNLDLVHECVVQSKQKGVDNHIDFKNQYSTIQSSQSVMIKLGDLLDTLADKWDGTTTTKNVSRERKMLYGISSGLRDKIVLIQLRSKAMVPGQPPRRRDDIIRLKLPGSLKFADGTMLMDAPNLGADFTKSKIKELQGPDKRILQLPIYIDLDGYYMENGCFRGAVDDCIRAGKVVDNSSEPIVQ